MIQKAVRCPPEAGITSADLYGSGPHGGATCFIKGKALMFLSKDKTYGGTLYSTDLEARLPPRWQGERTQAGIFPLP